MTTRLGVLAAFVMLACGQGPRDASSDRAPATSAGAPAPPPTTTDSLPITGGPSLFPSSTPELPPILAEPVRHATPAVPISGGTLLVTADGTTAVAADPDRDQVFLVDLPARSVRSVVLAPGDEPGRVVEGPAGTFYVAARRGGAVLAVDRASATVTRRFPACNAPRGVAFDTATNRVHVACRSGRLVSLDAASGALVAQLELDEDLRDVFVVGGNLVVSRFRSTEVLLLDAHGQPVRRAVPPRSDGVRPGVAYRAILHPNGRLWIAHLLLSDAPIGGFPGTRYYGGGCGFGLVQPALTTIGFEEEPPGVSAVSARLGNALGPLDLAVSRDGARAAVVASGNAWPVADARPTLLVVAGGENGFPVGDDGCSARTLESRHLPGEPVAVAFDASGRYVVQSRQPAMLILEGDVVIPLTADSRFDTGHVLFHMDTGRGISCASCHPEGGDDGHTWAFAGVGLRRSQSLEGGLIARPPFHWQGELPTFDALFDEVMIGRMGLTGAPSQAVRTALADWLDTVPTPAPADAKDPAAIERGRALFFDPSVGCATCHSGEAYTDDLPHDVGSGGTFITPSLRGIAFRAPYMHDGCAATLRDRFGLCGGSAHGNVEGLGPSQIDDLVAFMESL